MVFLTATARGRHAPEFHGHHSLLVTALKARVAQQCAVWSLHRQRQAKHRLLGGAFFLQCLGLLRAVRNSCSSSATSQSWNIPVLWLCYCTGTDAHLGSLWPFAETAASAAGEVASVSRYTGSPTPLRCTAGRADAQPYTVSLGFPN